MRKLLIIANWKMHFNVGEASRLVLQLQKHIKAERTVDVVLAPSMLDLQPLSLMIDRRRFRLAAQNAYFKDDGAFTGEVSFSMIRDLAQYCIIGHSERRLYFHESLEDIRAKVAAAVRNEIVPVICIGETQNEHQAGETKRVIHDQLVSALSELTSEEVENVVLVYEPSWAISTFEGKIAKPDEVERVISYMRAQVDQLYGEKAASTVAVLYGGSVDDLDVGGYLSVKGCDGALVGGASLHYLKFSAIVNAAVREQHRRSNGQ